MLWKWTENKKILIKMSAQFFKSMGGKSSKSPIKNKKNLKYKKGYLVYNK